jgi:hypothetical protein
MMSAADGEAGLLLLGMGDSGALPANAADTIFPFGAIPRSEYPSSGRIH